MKVCSRCGTEKSESEYLLVHPQRMNGRLRPECKVCSRQARRKQYLADPELFKARVRAFGAIARAKARALVDTYLSTHPCVDCGEDDPVVLDFDHVRGQKYKDVSRLVARAARLYVISREIEKCEVRCANCHRRATRKRRLRASSSG